MPGQIAFTVMPYFPSSFAARHRERALAERRRRGLGPRAVAHVDGDRGAPLVEPRRRGAPEPARGARDDGDATREVASRQWSTLSETIVSFRGPTPFSNA